MNKYEKAINYFYSVMEKGNIRNDAEQEAFEIAIKVLEQKNVYPKNKYFTGDVVPNVGRIQSRHMMDNDMENLAYDIVKNNDEVITKTGEEIDDIMTEYYKSKKVK